MLDPDTDTDTDYNQHDIQTRQHNSELQNIKYAMDSNCVMPTL